MSFTIAVVGATGAVGQEILRLLEARAVKQVRCFASARSLGKKVLFRGESISLEVLEADSFSDCDIVLLCAGGSISKAWARIAVDAGACVIDCSSHFRMDPAVPLIIPEINAHALQPYHRLIASPNCSTTLMLMALAPLHRIVPIQRIVAATYQAASGAGAVAMQELCEETRCHLNHLPFERSVVPFPYAFNLFPHTSALTESGYVEEELKMVRETHKILEDDTIKIHATCVRVPVLRAHSEALNVTFQRYLSVADAYAILKNAPGICLLEDRARNRFAMPLDSSGQEAVFYGRIREDHSHPNTLDLWVVGDQLLKGAALNAIQILDLYLLLSAKIV
jgi:aspartate-semialdehyde dehydrogenase